VLVFSRSLRGDNGEVIAIGLASLDVMTISLWISDMAVGPKTAAFLLGRDGTVLASAAAAVGLGERLAAAHPALATLHAGSAGGLTPAQPYAGTGPMMGRRVLRDAPLEAVVVLDAPHEMATWEGLRGAAFLAAGVISVLTFALLMVGLLFAARARPGGAGQGAGGAIGHHEQYCPWPAHGGLGAIGRRGGA
jgi:hypothetical protein